MQLAIEKIDQTKIIKYHNFHFMHTKIKLSITHQKNDPHTNKDQNRSKRIQYENHVLEKSVKF